MCENKMHMPGGRVVIMQDTDKGEALLQPLRKGGNRFLRDLPEVKTAPNILGFGVRAYHEWLLSDSGVVRLERVWALPL